MPLKAIATEEAAQALAAAAIVAERSVPATLTGKTIAGVSNTLDVRLGSGDVSGVLTVGKGGTGFNAAYLLANPTKTLRISSDGLTISAEDISPAPFEWVLFAGINSHELTVPERVGGRVLDLAGFPGVVGILSRSFTIKVELETTSGGLANVRLFNVTAGEVVTGSVLSTASNQAVELTGTLLSGVATGDLKTGNRYALQTWITGGGLGDRVTITNARVLIQYL